MRACTAAILSAKGRGLESRSPIRLPDLASHTPIFPAKSLAMTRELSSDQAQRKAISPANSNDFCFTPYAFQVATLPSRPQLTSLPSRE